MNILKNLNSLSVNVHSNTAIRNASVMLGFLTITSLSLIILGCGGGGEGIETIIDEPAGELTRNIDLVYVADPLGEVEVLLASDDGTINRNSTSGSMQTGSYFPLPSANGRYLAFKRMTDAGEVLYIDDLTDDDEAVRLSPNPVSNGGVDLFTWSPDNNYIAYQADQDVDGTLELFVISIDSGVAVKMHADKFSGELTGGAKWSPDGSKLVFVGNHVFESTRSVYVVNRDASGLINLVSDLPEGFTTTGFHWSPDGTKILYLVENVAGVSNVDSLYISDADGSNRIAIVNEGSNVSSPDWVPDGSGIVYRQATPTFEGFINNNLFWASADGAETVQLNGSLVVDGGVGNWLVSPDGLLVAYTADEDVFQMRDVYITEIDGSNNRKLSTFFEPGQSVTTMKWSPDSSKIAYVSDQSIPGVNRLYVAPSPFSSGTANAVDSVPFTGVSGFRWSPDSQQIAYTSDEDVSGVVELYVASNGMIDKFKVNTLMVDGGNVSFFRWSDDGTKLFYTADQDTDTVEELYIVANDGASRVKVNTPLAPGSSLSVFRTRWLPSFNP